MLKVTKIELLIFRIATTPNSVGSNSNRIFKIFLAHNIIELTPMEFDILLYLAQKRGNVVSSEELFKKVWKEKYLENNNTVMVHIRRIREKLKEDSKKPKFIKTVWGVGYKIEK